MITPKHDKVRGTAFDDAAGLEWLPLEETFMLHGDGISFIGGDGVAPLARVVDLTAPVHGPFSEDFRWVSVKGWPHGPIRLSDSQLAMFRLLWELVGKRPVTTSSQ